MHRCCYMTFGDIYSLLGHSSTFVCFFSRFVLVFVRLIVETDCEWDWQHRSKNKLKFIFLYFIQSQTIKFFLSPNFHLVSTIRADSFFPYPNLSYWNDCVWKLKISFSSNQRLKLGTVYTIKAFLKGNSDFITPFPYQFLVLLNLKYWLLGQYLLLRSIRANSFYKGRGPLVPFGT